MLSFNSLSHSAMAELSPARKKARLVKSYLTGKPIWASWQVTYACTFRCAGCSSWQEEVNFSAEALRREASLDDFRLGSAKLAEIGSLMINLAGGEPLLRRDLAEIVSIVAESHFPMITTNGWLANAQNASALWDAGLWGASVSLDFDDPEAHDDQRGRRGAAERARQALQILSRTRKRPYQRVNLMCVLNNRNLGEVEDLIRFAAENNAYFMIQPYAPLKNGNQDLMPMYPASEHLLALRQRYRNFLSNPGFLQQFDAFYHRHGIGGCKAGRVSLNIDNFLNVQKCLEHRDQIVGNLRDLTAPQMLALLNEEHRRNRCDQCWYCCRGEVEMLYSAKGLLAALPTMLYHQTFSARDFRMPPPSGLRPPEPARPKLVAIQGNASGD
jgi:MoaA/NifB/PqqE/SkfB family radical SAM enzyme